MNRIILSALLLFSTIKVNSQITKGNWMLSGNASISSLKSSSAASIQFKQTDILFSTGIGHFFIDKFAAGLRPSLTYGSNNIANSSTVFGIGPFVRYYCLKPENIVNILIDAGYLYGAISGGQKSNTMTLYAGPVVYFNTSVGIEFLIGYSTSKVVGFEGRNNKLQFGIGFQFHFEKDK
jgi:hypothetical protein